MAPTGRAARHPGSRRSAGARRTGTVLLLALVACYPYTTRPGFPPVFGAVDALIDLPVAAATDSLAAALRGDSLPTPIRQMSARDGYVESPWFDAATGQPTKRRPLGLGVVRVRAWLVPGRPGESHVTLEAVYRPVADPSLPERLLDRQLPADHPVVIRLVALLDRLRQRFPPVGLPPPAAPAR